MVLQGWLTAIRPKTLLLSQAPVIVGACFALHEEMFAPWRLLLCSLMALFLQMGANMANDLYDGLRGVDQPGRLGPVRALQAGLLSVRALFTGMVVVLTVGMVCTLILGWSSHRAFFLIGPVCALAAWAYTGLSLASRGLGELLALIFFGPVATAGTYLATTGHNSRAALLLGLATGGLAAAVMLTNNLRDIPTDRAAVKRTLAVRIGERWSRLLLVMLVLLAAVPLITSGSWELWYIRLAVLMLFGMSAQNAIRPILLGASGMALNLTLASLVRLTAMHALLLGIITL